MEKFSTKLKIFFIIFAIVFVLFYALYLLGHYIGTQVFFNTLLFPFGFLCDIIKMDLWNTYGPAHWINDEVTELFMFPLFVIGQTFVYYYIYKFIKVRKKRKMEIQE